MTEPTNDLDIPANLYNRLMLVEPMRAGGDSTDMIEFLSNHWTGKITTETADELIAAFNRWYEATAPDEYVHPWNRLPAHVGRVDGGGAAATKAARLAVKAIMELAGIEPPTLREQARIFGVNVSNITRDAADLDAVIEIVRQLLPDQDLRSAFSQVPSATVPNGAWSRATVTIYRDHQSGAVDWLEFTETIHDADGELVATVQHEASRKPADE